MAWFEDLSVCTYFRVADQDRLRAVGWLERGQPYARGSVDAEDFTRLAAFAHHPWEPSFFLGWHDCDLCDPPREFTRLHVARVCIEVGKHNLFFPTSDGDLFVAPTLVLHYIQDHGYCPPDVFLDAVRACPPMDSAEYLAAVTALDWTWTSRS